MQRSQKGRGQLFGGDASIVWYGSQCSIHNKLNYRNPFQNPKLHPLSDNPGEKGKKTLLTLPLVTYKYSHPLIQSPSAEFASLLQRSSGADDSRSACPLEHPGSREQWNIL